MKTNKTEMDLLFEHRSLSAQRREEIEKADPFIAALLRLDTLRIELGRAPHRKGEQWYEDRLRSFKEEQAILDRISVARRPLRAPYPPHHVRSLGPVRDQHSSTV